MITGAVNSVLEGTLRLTVHDLTGQVHEFEAVIDTGFNGFLTLPPALIATLGLPWLCRQQGQLADGGFHVFDVYAVTVVWDGRPRAVELEAADSEPLLGMELMRGYALRMDVVPGGLVMMTVLP